MKYCHNCGNQIEDNVQFCPACGAPQQQISNQQAQYNNPPQYQFTGNVQVQEPEKKKTGCGSILLWIFFWPIMLWVHAFRKKQAGWFILAAIVTFLLFALYGAGSRSGTGTRTSSSSSQGGSNSSALLIGDTKPTKTPTLPPTPIIYSSVTVKTMLDDLKANAARAKQTYEGKYLEITGYVSNIDASGKYFSLDPSNDPWDLNLTNVQVFVKNENQKQTLLNLTKGQKVTVKTKCTRVGEVLGYYLDWQ